MRVDLGFYKLLAEHLPGTAVLVFDRSLRFVVAHGTSIFADAIAQHGPLEGRLVSEVSAPENLARVIELYRATLAGEAGEREMSRAGRTYALHTIPLRKHGRVVAGVVVAQDITPLVETREALRLQSESLTSVLATVSEGVVVADAQGRMVLVNPAAERMLGGGAVDGGPDAWVNAYACHKPDGTPYRGEELPLARALAGEPEARADVILRSPSLVEEFWTDAVARPLPGGGAVAVFRDVTQIRYQAIERKQLLTLLKYKAETDPLTRLGNRRQGEACIVREIARAFRRGTPLSFLMFDVDHFKKVNDTFGHLTGDQVLVTVAKTIVSTLRAEDVVCRWGGEEILAVLPDADASAASLAAERVRRAVEASTAPTVTVSVGVAQWKEGEPPYAAIGRADGALYDAKKRGRNRVCG